MTSKSFIGFHLSFKPFLYFTKKIKKAFCVGICWSFVSLKLFLRRDGSTVYFSRFRLLRERYLRAFIKYLVVEYLSNVFSKATVRGSSPGRGILFELTPVRFCNFFVIFNVMSFFVEGP